MALLSSVLGILPLQQHLQSQGAGCLAARALASFEKNNKKIRVATLKHQMIVISTGRFTLLSLLYLDFTQNKSQYFFFFL